MSAIIHKEIADGFRSFRNYISRYKFDGGSMYRDGEIARKFLKFINDNNIPKPVFSWFGEAATKSRVSGIYNYATKLYSLFGLNDATQTTSTSQPYLSGNIAPTERLYLKNPNGGSNYMTHPTISFAANEAWSVQTTITSYGSNAGVNGRILGNDTASKTRIELAPTGDTLYIYGETANGSIAIPNRKGKSTVIFVSYNGNGICTVSIGTTVIGTVNVNSAFIFNTIGRASGGQNFYGETKQVAIWNNELNTNQRNILAFDSIQRYPEIPSVTIGTQTWATSNCEMVATPQGNLIANVTDNTAWANSTTLYNNAYNGASGTEEQKTYAAVKAAAMWSFYNNDVALGSVYGKLYNWYAVKLLQMDIDYYNTANPTTPWGYRVPTNTDFNTLATALGGASVAGGKMKVANSNYWFSTTGTNLSGFSSIGSGYRDVTGIFTSSKAMFTIFKVDNSQYWGNLQENNGFTVLNSGYIYGCSLRLIKS